MYLSLELRVKKKILSDVWPEGSSPLVCIKPAFEVISPGPQLLGEMYNVFTLAK